MKIKENVYFEHISGRKYFGDLHVNYYENNDRIALQLIDSSEGYDEPIADCTVNISNIYLKENQVVIKDYTESEGMLKSLIDQKIVKKIYEYQSGFVTFPVCELLIEIPVS